MRRLARWQPINVLAPDGVPFGFVRAAFLDEHLQFIDRALSHSPTFATDDSSTNSTIARRLFALQSDGQLVSRRRIASEMEEAAESSIMEGAATTRRDAVQLLLHGRSPSSVAEKMILNNYLAIKQIKELAAKPLSIEMLIDLQSTLTAGTLRNPDHSGRLRTDEDAVSVADTRSGEVIFTPPPEHSLVPLLTRVVDFANSAHTGTNFIHPVIKASILHFLIGYAHPFPDGNGRTARAVFYWCALRSGYTVFEYLSISEIIRAAYASYPQAFVDCETDDNDLTYFIEFKLKVIRQCIERLASHVASEQERLTRSESLLKLASGLNTRQRLLLDHALRKSAHLYTVKSHKNSNGITPNTARADLDDLVKRRLMVTSKRGKEVVYTIAPGLAEKLARVRGKGK